jgi:hypothetical protein
MTLPMLLLVLGASPATETPPEQPLRFEVKARFKAEKPGDGAPTLEFVYRFTNVGQVPLYLSWYGSPVKYRRVAPRSMFKVQPTTPVPHASRPPTAEDFFAVAPGETVEKTEWEWVGVFMIEFRPDLLHQYTLRRPGRVTLSMCYQVGWVMDASTAHFLPPGATLWPKAACAPDVRVDIKALAKAG